MRFGWVLGACLLVACGDNIVLTLDEYPVAYGKAWCRFQLRCGELGSADDCASYVRRYLSPDLVAAVQAGVIDFDPEAAHECVEILDRLTCDPTTAVWKEPSCFGIFAGTRHSGEPCTFGDECISRECWLAGASCDSACCTGYCAGDERPVPGHIGDRCAFAPCAEGRCDGGLCVPLLAAGEACGRTNDCEIGLSCLDQCQVLPTHGERCNGTCRDIGEMCSPVDNVCEPVRTLGQSCYVTTDCSPYFRCSVSGGGNCEALQAGDSCFWGACPLPLVCDDATFRCIDPKPDGATCGYSSECASHTCRGQLCTSETCI